MNNFTEIDVDPIFKLHINVRRLLALLDMFTLIIKICKEAKYPEDLEDIYDILDKYLPDWRSKDWRLDV